MAHICGKNIFRQFGKNMGKIFFDNLRLAKFLKFFEYIALFFYNSTSLFEKTIFISIQYCMVAIYYIQLWKGKLY